MRRVERFTLNFNLNVTLAVEILGFHVVQELTEPAQFALFVNRGTRFSRGLQRWQGSGRT